MSKAVINISGVVGVDVTLKNVISQFKTVENPSEVVVNIDSQGGYVTEGRNIYDYLKALEIPVTTVAVRAWSIAASIFMAGDSRLVDGNSEFPLMIHMPLIQNLTGNSDTLTEVAAELVALEKEFINFYTDLLDIPKETIEALLKGETNISPDEAVSMGFATAIKEELQIVAYYEPNKKPDSVMTKLEKTLNAIAQKLGITGEAEKVALIVTDATGAEVDFYELEDGDTPAVGDKARKDGSDIDGSVVMPSGETFVFEGGELKEIQPSSEDGSEDGSEESEDAPEATAEIIHEVITWSLEVNESSFEVGTQLTYSFDEETHNLGAGEYKLQDGRSVVTDSSGVIVKVKEVASDGEPEAPAEDAPEANASKDNKEDAVLAEVLEKLTENNTTLKAEIVALKKLMGSGDVDEDKSEKKKSKPVAEMTPLERHRYYKSL